MQTLYQMRIVLSQLFLNLYYLLIITIVRKYINFCVSEGPFRREVVLPITSERTFFNIGIFRKNATKCVKLTVESYVCDN